MKLIALFSILLASVFPLSAAIAATKASSVTRHNITWTFDKEYEIGQFVNGDWWVLGPVKIVSITNDLSDEKFKPEGADVSGSMVNPVVDNSTFQASQRQGFDDRIKYYDSADRLKSSGEPLFNPWHAGNRPPPFPREMWETYRAKFPTTYDKKWDAPEITDYITQPKE